MADRRRWLAWTTLAVSIALVGAAGALIAHRPGPMRYAATLTGGHPFFGPDSELQLDLAPTGGGEGPRPQLRVFADNGQGGRLVVPSRFLLPGDGRTFRVRGRAADLLPGDPGPRALHIVLAPEGMDLTLDLPDVQHLDVPVDYRPTPPRP